MRPQRVLTLITAAAVAAAGLLLAPTAASAQTLTEASCSGDALVQRTLEAGSSWEMCWRIDSYRGLVLDKVAYQPRDDESPMLVLDSIALAQLNVPYDSGMTEYNDVTTYQVGGRRMQALTDVDCPTGVIRDAWADDARGVIPAMCVAEEDSGIAYRSNVNRDKLYVGQGTDLVMSMTSRIGWYEYITEYRFHDDGEVSVRLGATGDLSPNDYVNQVNQGWPIGEGDTDFAVSHYHSAFWKVDFGIDNGDQLVEKFATTPTGELGTDTDTGKTAILETEITPIDTERKTLGANREAYRVVNPDSLNADGHARSYEIIVPRDQAYNLNPETDFDIAFSNAESGEIHASYNLLPAKANQGVTDYIADGEALTDPVAWVNVGFHHINRDEDQSPMPIHWQGFTLYPRDFAHQAPNIPEGRKWVNGDMRGVPDPNVTPTPTPSTPAPEPSTTTEPPVDGGGTEPPVDGGTTPTPAPEGEGGGGNGVAPAGTIEFGSAEVALGGSQSVTASGFAPNESVTATMFSDPLDLGTFQADEDGVVEFQFQVPTDTEPGPHRVVVEGQTSGTVAEGTFTVAVATPASVIAALQNTGTDANVLAWSAMVLLAAGLVLAGLGWSRRRPAGIATA